MTEMALTAGQQAIVDIMETFHAQGDDYVHVSDLAEALEVTPSAVSQHMKRLLAWGIVEKCPVLKIKSGKPAHPYRLTGAA